MPEKSDSPAPEVPPGSAQELPMTKSGKNPPDLDPAKVLNVDAKAEPVTATELPLGDGSQPISLPMENRTPGAVGDERKPVNYDSLDWSKSNAALARETGVTRQRISQVRKEKFKVNGEETQPDFSDITGKPPAGQPLPPLATEAPPMSPEKVVNYEAMAAAVFDMSTGTLVVAFGEEWKPRDEKERGAVVTALAMYFQSKQMQDLPPGLILTAVLLAYSAPRLRAPSTSSKIKAAWTWFKVKLASLRKKK